jgi:hypothetical protein
MAGSLSSWDDIDCCQYMGGLHVVPADAPIHQHRASQLCDPFPACDAAVSTASRPNVRDDANAIFPVHLTTNASPVSHID